MYVLFANPYHKVYSKNDVTPSFLKEFLTPQQLFEVLNVWM